MEMLLTQGNKILLAVIIGLGSAIFALRVIMILRIIAAGRSDNRLDHFWHRLTQAFIYTFGQSKVLRNRVTGLAHLALFYGFLIAALETVNMIWHGFTGDFFLGIITGSPFFVWVVDVFVVLVIVAILVIAYRRYVIHPPVVLNSGEAALVLATIFLLMASLLVKEAAEHTLGVVGGGCTAGGSIAFKPPG